MYSNEKWILTVISTVFGVLAVASSASAQTRVLVQTQSLMPADEARELFNVGQRFFDEYRFTDAENKFREVIRRFPTNPIADRADYYLIRTLSQVGKRGEALGRIGMFSGRYPRSKWVNDVQELRIQLTNQVPASAETILRVSAVSPGFPTPAPNPANPPRTPVTAARFTLELQTSDPEVSLQQEIMRAVFRNNGDRGIEIATERLKANPADPVVLASLNLVAANASIQATSMLMTIVKSSPNLKARRDAIFWLSRAKGDGDAAVDTLTGLLPMLTDEDSEAVIYSLGQIHTDKASNAIAAVARDKNRSEALRNEAVYRIGQSHTTNRIGVLEDIYRNSMDNSRIRQQVIFVLNQTRQPQAMTIIGSAASNDPDFEVRRQAVYWLGQNKTPEATQAVEKLLQRK
jgi:tetratricopeptide (TPR) repeat protein